MRFEDIPRFSPEHFATVRAASPSKQKAFRKGITKSEATDALTYLCAAHSYTELVDGMGWTPDRYERWLGDTIYQMLFAD